MPELVQQAALIADAMLTAVLVVLHTMILRGFLPIFARPDGTAVWHLAASYVWISSSVAARAIYWAYAPETLRAFLGKGLVNCAFGAALIYGAYLVLRLLWLIIPDIDRDKYSILTAPLYPASTEWRLSLILNLLRNNRDDC
ncbi:MAG: hypothetical protein VYB46_08690 [Pseudomonadota bacterium]|nr:hypothetical protein [Pseudomonadota bacterium]